MSAQRLFLASAILLVGAIVLSAIALSRPALADAGRTAVCTTNLDISKTYSEKGERSFAPALNRWLDIQLASGRTSILQTEESSVLCAW